MAGTMCFIVFSVVGRKKLTIVFFVSSEKLFNGKG